MATALFRQALDVRISLEEREGRSPLARTLAAIRHLTSASGALLANVDRETDVERIVECVGMEPCSLEEEALTGALSNDRRTSASLLPQWTSSNDHGLDVLCVEIARRDSQETLLLLAFPRLTAACRTRVAAMVPHLVTLIVAHLDCEDRLRDLRDRHAAATAALDHGACGVIALRADHTLLFANRAAAALLTEDDGLHLRHGRVRPTDYRFAVRFEAAIDAVTHPPRTIVGERSTALMMLLPGGREQHPMIAVVAPMDAPTGVDGSEQERSALIYVLRSGPNLSRGVETLAQLHGLSRVETRLLAHLCGGLTVSESADEMHIKLETARAYLKQIFAKTSTHRQSELVGLMSRYLRAVRGDFDFQAA